MLCSAIEVSDSAWKQAQLGLRFGGLGLCSLSCHAASAAFIASLSSSGLGLSNNHHLQQAVVVYNSKVALHHTITAESALASPTPERELSSRIDKNQFKSLLEASSPANKAHANFCPLQPLMQLHGCQWSTWSAMSSRLQ